MYQINQGPLNGLRSSSIGKFRTRIGETNNWRRRSDDEKLSTHQIQILGGRGLPGGEAGLKTEDGMKKLFSDGVSEKSSVENASKSGDQGKVAVEGFDAFEKELSGMVGGFPGGEKGLNQFLQAYPPPSKVSKELEKLKDGIGGPGFKARTVAPPLLMPGMTVIVKEARNPYYMFTGIVQRVTDGRAGVIFEGGNWDKLVTFRITDLERTASGPPMSNPKSAILNSGPGSRRTCFHRRPSLSCVLVTWSCSVSVLWVPLYGT
ncbi:hypothetical protein R1flu_024889 [Riccia fluitans]|uniref:Chlororespiratory reduction31 n=1 Tax=Riccia fluitans TaxID=41844 RepID=A0ABD1XWB9_9MARC